VRTRDALQDDLELAEEYQPLGSWRLDRMLEEDKTDRLGLNGQRWPLGKPMPKTRCKETEGT
jgi:hypothetical protein